MKTKTFLFLGIIIIVVAGAFLFLQDGDKEASPAGDSSGLIVSQNAIYVAEQAPGEGITVSVVHLETPGFVAIHEDVSGVPGKILGMSGLLPAGETKNLPPIALSRATKDGETLYTMLHLDDGDGTFDAAKDKPAQDKVGGSPVMMIFTVSAEAEEPTDVSL